MALLVGTVLMLGTWTVAQMMKVGTTDTAVPAVKRRNMVAVRVVFPAVTEPVGSTQRDERSRSLSTPAG